MEFSFQDFKASLKGQPKEVKLLAIKQEISNHKLEGAHRPVRGMTQAEIEHSRKNPPPPLSNEEKAKIEERRKVETERREKAHAERQVKIQAFEELLNEIQNNAEAYESQTKRTELIPFMYDRDLNWFFNAKNIAAQKNLVMPTYEYFNEGPRRGQFEPLDFLNLLQKQIDDLQKNLEKPFDVLQDLSSLPLTDLEKHTLLGFILKWFGGYPINNLNEQYNTVLTLVQKEFLKYPEQTPEKEFCSNNTQAQKEMREAAAHLNATTGFKVTTPNEPKLPVKYQFPESHYIKKVPFDFGDLPEYVIKQGVIHRFENTRMLKDDEYQTWQIKLTTFLDSIPNEYRLKALTRGISYGEAVYKYHLDNECTSPQNCVLNQSWERRIALAKNMLERAQPTPEPENGEPVANGKNKEFTTARQVLAVHYVMEYMKVGNVDATEKARFIQFLTGKETGAKVISNTNIYKKIKSPLSTDERTLLGDLQFVRGYFEKLNLSEIVKVITNEISSRE